MGSTPSPSLPCGIMYSHIQENILNDLSWKDVIYLYFHKFFCWSIIIVGWAVAQTAPFLRLDREMRNFSFSSARELGTRTIINCFLVWIGHEWLVLSFLLLSPI